VEQALLGGVVQGEADAVPVRRRRVRRNWISRPPQRSASALSRISRLADSKRISSFWPAVRSLLPLPVALIVSSAARQLSLPPLPMQPRDCDRA
jgi:transposase InsO family protein